MALFKVPTSTDREISDYTQSTILDGREYLLRFYWNQRQGTWYLDLKDQDDSPISVGIPLVLGQSLLAHVADNRKPPGALFLVDLTQTHTPANIDELGDRVILFYADQDSLNG